MIGPRFSFPNGESDDVAASRQAYALLALEFSIPKKAKGCALFHLTNHPNDEVVGTASINRARSRESHDYQIARQSS